MLGFIQTACRKILFMYTTFQINLEPTAVHGVMQLLEPDAIGLEVFSMKLVKIRNPRE